MTFDGARDLHTTSEAGFGGKRRRPPRRPFLFLCFQASRPLDGGARFCLAGVDEVVLGQGKLRQTERRRENGKLKLLVSVNCRAVSERHARMRRTSEEWVVEDLGSRNGVYINGSRIRGSAPLSGRDVMTLGRAFFVLGHHHTEADSDFDAADTTAALPGMLTLLPSHADDLANLAAIAHTKTSVVLVGETGTGKELLARALHRISGRAGPFRAINCAGLARTLIESELFGHVKGAFSGAGRAQTGHIQEADGGTLLLDEIVAAPTELQTALLRVLQEGQVVPVGGRKAQLVDVRFVAAAQRPLDEAAARHEFRADLGARLEGFVLRVPPLRERIADMGIFVAHALRAQGATEADNISFTLHAGLRLLQNDWPGNVRQLAAAITRARTLSRGAAIDEEHLLLPAAPRMDEGGARSSSQEIPPGRPDRIDPEQIRARLIADLEQTKGDVSETARRLGRNRTLVYKWLRRFGINENDFRESPHGAA
jgi:DNA-binding NtrC family response regulator